MKFPQLPQHLLDFCCHQPNDIEVELVEDVALGSSFFEGRKWKPFFAGRGTHKKAKREMRISCK
jgi:hypothetical protein